MTFFIALAALFWACCNRWKLNDMNDRLKRLEMAEDHRRANAGLAKLFLLICLAFGTSNAWAAADRIPMMHLSPAVRGWCVNPDGSCVQCSIVMCAFHCNDPNAGSLLWDTDYGPAVRGGSNPQRVEAYLDRRKIKAWSVTGRTVDDTLPWMIWACRTGRFAAIGAGQAHFQTLYGYDPIRKIFYVCNNNSTHKIDEYPEPAFRQLHAASGPWCVILEKPSSPPPSFYPWWIRD